MNERQERIALLNRLGEEWFRLKQSSQDNAAAEARYMDIWVLAFELYGRVSDDRTDVFNDFMTGEFFRFEPSKAKLSTFLSKRLNCRNLDREEKEACAQKKVQSYESNRNMDDENPFTQIPDPSGQQALDAIDDRNSQAEIDETMVLFIALVIDFKSCQSGRAANDTRWSYTRLFFTGGMIDYLHRADCEIEDRKRAQRHEQELFSAMNLTFLDYCLIAHCRTILKIWESAILPYDVLVPTREPGPTPLPFQQDVYISYLNRMEHNSVSNAVISQQMTHYRTYLQERMRNRKAL